MIFGTVYDAQANGALRLTVVATGFEPRVTHAPHPHSAPAHTGYAGYGVAAAAPTQPHGQTQSARVYGDANAPYPPVGAHAPQPAQPPAHMSPATHNYQGYQGNPASDAYDEDEDANEEYISDEYGMYDEDDEEVIQSPAEARRHWERLLPPR